MFLQIALSPQAKKHIIYELPHELSNDLRL